MKKLKLLFKIGFYFVNIVLIIFYLYPGSILGYLLYGDSFLQPQITRDFIISSNHFYIFIILSFLGMFAYWNKKKIKYVVLYLFLLSIILELFHIIIPNRGFEWSDLFGNFFGVLIVIIIYKVRNQYV